MQAFTTVLAKLGTALCDGRERENERISYLHIEP